MDGYEILKRLKLLLLSLSVLLLLLLLYFLVVRSLNFYSILTVSVILKYAAINLCYYRFFTIDNIWTSHRYDKNLWI